MLNKKGQGLSMNYIVVALLALAVLVVIILFFTGGMQKIFGQTAQAGEITEQQMSIWRKQCELYCSVDKAAYCSHDFNVKDKEGEATSTYTCSSKYTGTTSKTNSLEVPCAEIKTTADCPKKEEKPK